MLKIDQRKTSYVCKLCRRESLVIIGLFKAPHRSIWGNTYSRPIEKIFFCRFCRGVYIGAIRWLGQKKRGYPNMNYPVSISRVKEVMEFQGIINEEA